MMGAIIANTGSIIHGLAIVTGYIVLAICAWFACWNVIRAMILATHVLWAIQHVTNVCEGRRYVRLWPRIWWSRFRQFAFADGTITESYLNHHGGEWVWQPWVGLRQVRSPERSQAPPKE